ncbi:MAG: transcription elongation factor Spt5 [Candidatus Aenigmarchaeota archaeon]|nr:transcription elongation factor Spt5 [Candidatus Aenigmarchaeota archaeon]
MSDIYAIRTTSGREHIVMDLIYAKIKRDNLNVKSIVHPGELKGYIFIEGPESEVRKATQGVMHIKGFINKRIKVSEIQRFFEHKKASVTVNVGDIVEIIGGPFKGEKGKIQRIDKVKEEVTVELLEASIPIPVTISVELVKLIKRGSDANEQRKD